MPEAAPACDDPTGSGDRHVPLTSVPTEFDVRAKDDASVVGPYRLLQKIAEGGMGEVWLAEQKQPVRRRVALKLIKAGMDSREIVLRFESERQALALMDHPAIATVYDAGSTAQGTPYFAMEYVAGVPISNYCDNHKLTTRQRLQLFIHVCEGVQHAHQKAIIHRDLKPSNILVTEVDGRPVPKIIDFGIAKALSQKLIEQTMFTRVGSIVGTPEYMSPEQASSGGEDIDTRSDVYSLGVILYELLAGAPPLELKAAGFFEFVQKLRENETPKPSTKVRSRASLPAADVKGRKAELTLLAKELRGDLDCITLRCLEKDRKRRYGSPAELAADIQRYLQHLPVLATTPSATYRFHKFAQRNRGLLAAVCGLILVLIAGSGISVYQAVRARNAEQTALVQRDRADAEADTAEAVNDFLQNDLLSQAGADRQGGGEAAPDPEVKVRTLVDRAATAVSKKLKGKPMVEADLRRTLGETYLSLGLLKEAGVQMRQAHELNVRTRGPHAEKTIESLQALGTVEFNNGQYAESAQHQGQALEEAQKVLGPKAPLTLQAMQSLAVNYVMLGQPAKAEPLLKKVLDLQIRSVGYDNAETLDTSDSLAFLYIGDGRYAEATALLERGLQSYRKLYGPDHPNTQRELFGLARVLTNSGDYAKAEELASGVYRSNLRLLGASHFKTISAEKYLARIDEAQGKLDEAEKLAADALRKSVANAGERNVDTLNSKEVLASIYEKQDEYAKAATLLEDVERRADSVFGAANPDALIARQLLGSNLLHQKQCDRAARYLEAVEQRWQQDHSSNWRRFEAQALLGEARACQKDFGAAEPLLLSGYQGLKENEQKMPANQRGKVKAAAANLAALYSAWKKPEPEQQWRTVSEATH